jgi:hypothetical protein
MEISGRRPSYPRGGGELKVFADDSDRKVETAGNLAKRKPRIMPESENVFDLTHGKPIGWHRILSSLD